MKIMANTRFVDAFRALQHQVLQCKGWCCNARRAQKTLEFIVFRALQHLVLQCKGWCCIRPVSNFGASVAPWKVGRVVDNVDVRGLLDKLRLSSVFWYLEGQIWGRKKHVMESQTKGRANIKYEQTQSIAIFGGAEAQGQICMGSGGSQKRWVVHDIVKLVP